MVNRKMSVRLAEPLSLNGLPLNLDPDAPFAARRRVTDVTRYPFPEILP
jgi:hypothetical protein